MKLNLGCGGLYKKDYINIDAYNDIVADKIMSVYNLRIKDNSIEEIAASQIIEHLGLTGSIYCLSECFRVLKPNGKLIIETPDIKTSFKKYVKGDRETRKNLLPWIYGIDMIGMQHRFCFPDDLLEDILRDIGFTSIKKKFFELDVYEPILNIVCKKTKNFNSYQTISKFRKKLLKKNLVNVNDQILSLEKENLIKKFQNEIDKFLKYKKKIHIENIVTEGGLQSPKVTYAFLQEIKDDGIISIEKIKKYIDAIEVLVKVDFPSILTYSFREIDGFVGKQKNLFKIVNKMGKITIKNLIDPTKKSLVEKTLFKTKKKIKSFDKNEFYSEKMLLLKSNKFFQKGAKNFIQKNYENAIDNFKISIDFNRDQLLSYWNLARIFLQINDKSMSKKYYSYTINILEMIDCRHINKIKDIINDERKSLIQFENPIFSLEELTI